MALNIVLEVTGFFLLMMNTHHEPSEFTLQRDFSGDWRIIVDTARPELAPAIEAAQTTVRLEARSFMILAHSLGKG